MRATPISYRALLCSWFCSRPVAPRFQGPRTVCKGICSINHRPGVKASGRPSMRRPSPMSASLWANLTSGELYSQPAQRPAYATLMFLCAAFTRAATSSVLWHTPIALPQASLFRRADPNAGQGRKRAPVTKTERNETRLTRICVSIAVLSWNYRKKKVVGGAGPAPSFQIQSSLGDFAPPPTLCWFSRLF